MDAATIVKRIRALGGISRRELADLAGLSPSTIGRIEQGTLDPTWGALSRILDATGYRISGDTVVSAGDPMAVAAAQSVLESVFDSYTGVFSATATGTLPPATPVAGATGALGRIDAQAEDPGAEPVRRWLRRWGRAGWLSDKADADDMVTLAIAAGNAAKIARRNTARRDVTAGDGWRALARALEEAGSDYAVTGLVATRADRSTAAAASPVIYVQDPGLVVERLGLEETAPGRGVLLLAPAGDELARAETEGGIRFVSRAQGVLDAFAGSGREPDKAEDALRYLLAAGA